MSDLEKQRRAARDAAQNRKFTLGYNVAINMTMQLTENEARALHFISEFNAEDAARVVAGIMKGLGKSGFEGHENAFILLMEKVRYEVGPFLDQCDKARLAFMGHPQTPGCHAHLQRQLSPQPELPQRFKPRRVFPKIPPAPLELKGPAVVVQPPRVIQTPLKPTPPPFQGGCP